MRQISGPPARDFRRDAHPCVRENPSISRHDASDRVRVEMRLAAARAGTQRWRALERRDDGVLGVAATRPVFGPMPDQRLSGNSKTSTGQPATE